MYGAGQKLDVGDVLGTTAKVVGGRFVNLVAIAAVCLSPLFVGLVLLGLLATGAQSIDPETARQLGNSPGAMGGLVAGGVVIAILTVLLTYVSQGAILHTTLEHLAERTPTIGASLQVAINKLLPILGASILVGLLVFVGTLLCIVPGVIWAIMYYVTIPVVVAEGIHGQAAMQRSAELTNGNRWVLFATVIVFGLITMALGLAFGIAQAPFELAAQEAPILSIVSAIISFAQNLLQTILASVLVGVVYARLRGVREGVDVESLADVFA